MVMLPLVFARATVSVVARLWCNYPPCAFPIQSPTKGQSEIWRS